MPNLSYWPSQPAVDADWTYWPAFRRRPDTHRLRLSTQIKGGTYCVDMCSLLLREQTTLGRRAPLCSKISLMHISPLERKLNTAGEKDPNLSTLVSHRRPSLAWDDTPAPSGNRSPDLPLPGPELSRGFSRSVSRPHGQVLGDAITRWPYSHPKVSRRLHWRWPWGQRCLRLGASRYPPFFVSWILM